MSDPIVIVGAGMAGVAAAYHLAIVHRASNIVLIEAENPLSMTSDKSTEAYRNWWPGPDGAMTQYMNDSIDRIEAIARASGNRINMNRRGYLFASADAGKAAWLIDMAEKAARFGGGAVRVHDKPGSYDPAPDAAFDAPLTGADIVTNVDEIRRTHPYLSPTTKVIAHARRAGWLSAQQLGAIMLEAALAAGVKLMRGRVTLIETTAARVTGVGVETSSGRETIATSRVIIAGGPYSKPLAAMAGVDLPIIAERHLKISFNDTQGIIARTAPMLIWLDGQTLPWSPEERDTLSADPTTRWLTEPFPWGAHGRPDGRGTTVLALYNYDNEAADVVFPLPDHEHYGEITMRGMVTMVPGLQTYVDQGIRPYIDGGYYVKARDNRPLIGATPVEGLYLNCAFSGFGIMASCAGGDMVARSVLGKPLPSFAPVFALARFNDAAYLAALDTWGDGGQL